MISTNSIWLYFSNINIDLESFYGVAIIAALICPIFIVYKYFRPDIIISSIAGTAIFFILFTKMLTILSYLTTTIVFPFQDKNLNQIDLMLGFNFTDLVIFVDSSPLITTILSEFYYSSLYHIIFITIILGIKSPQYIMEFCNLYLMCLLATIVVAIFLPAIDPYEYLKIPLE